MAPPSRCEVPDLLLLFLEEITQACWPSSKDTSSRRNKATQCCSMNSYAEARSVATHNAT